MQSNLLEVDETMFRPTSLNPILHLFTCKICDSVIYEGQQCTNQRCPALYCKQCLPQYRNCVLCGERRIPGDMHKRVREMIELLRLVCPGCNEEFMYRQMFEHLPSCEGAQKIKAEGRTLPATSGEEG